MNILSNLISLVYLTVGLGAIVFVADYSGFDNEFGATYHNCIKARLVKHKVLKKRRDSGPSYNSSERQDSTAVWFGKGILGGLDRFFSSLLNKLGDLIFSPFAFLVVYVTYVVYINRNNQQMFVGFRLI